MEDASLTRSQVAALLGVSPERVRQLTVSGVLPCTPTPLGRLYRASDVEALSGQRAIDRDALRRGTLPAPAGSAD